MVGGAPSEAPPPTLNAPRQATQSGCGWDLMIEPRSLVGGAQSDAPPPTLI